MNHPDLFKLRCSFCMAFDKIAVERFRQSPPSLVALAEHYIRQNDDIFGPDPCPYGIKANAKAIETSSTMTQAIINIRA